MGSSQICAMTGIACKHSDKSGAMYLFIELTNREECFLAAQLMVNSYDITIKKTICLWVGLLFDISFGHNQRHAIDLNFTSLL